MITPEQFHAQCVGDFEVGNRVRILYGMHTNELGTIDFIDRTVRPLGAATLHIRVKLDGGDESWYAASLLAHTESDFQA